MNDSNNFKSDSTNKSNLKVFRSKIRKNYWKTPGAIEDKECKCNE